MSHTPAPWHVGGTGSAKAPMRNGEPVRVWAVDEGAVCEVSTRRSLGNPANPIEQANAAFIVKACNAHDELVAALEAIANALSEPAPIVTREVVLIAAKTARAALAKVQS